MIYLLHVPSLGLCKIGFATDIVARLSVGEAFIPGSYVVAAARVGGRRLEKAIHRAAIAHHVHGEWFRDFTAVSSIFSSVIVDETPKAPLPEAIEAAARELGVSDEAIRKWKERGSVPGKWHLAIIDKSNGRVPPAALQAVSA